MLYTPNFFQCAGNLALYPIVIPTNRIFSFYLVFESVHACMVYLGLAAMQGGSACVHAHHTDVLTIYSIYTYMHVLVNNASMSTIRQCMP